MRLRGDVDRVRVRRASPARTGLRRTRRSPERPPLRSATSCLVAHLEVTGRSRRADRAHARRRPPCRQRHANCAGVARVRPRARERSLRHLQERERGVAAVADQVDVLRLAGTASRAARGGACTSASCPPSAAFPPSSAYASKIARDRGAVGIPERTRGAMSAGVQPPVPDRRDPRDVVEEAFRARSSARGGARAAERRTTRPGSRAPASGRGRRAGASCPSG